MLERRADEDEQREGQEEQAEGDFDRCRVFFLEADQCLAAEAAQPLDTGGFRGSGCGVWKVSGSGCVIRSFRVDLKNGFACRIPEPGL